MLTENTIEAKDDYSQFRINVDSSLVPVSVLSMTNNVRDEEHHTIEAELELPRPQEDHTQTTWLPKKSQFAGNNLLTATA